MERYIICSDEGGKTWFLGYDRETNEPGWFVENEDLKNCKLIVYSDYNAVKRLLVAIHDKTPDAYIKIINF